jgi:hypothetical protein
MAKGQRRDWPVKKMVGAERTSLQLLSGVGKEKRIYVC